MKLLVGAVLFTVLAFGSGSPMSPPSTHLIGIDQKLNATLPLDVTFVDEDGATVLLRKFFHGRPVLIAPVYFSCTMLCSQILHGVVSGLRPLFSSPAAILRLSR